MDELHRVYKEQNGHPVIDLSISHNGDTYHIIERVNDINIKNVTYDELHIIIRELDVPRSVKLEIGKTIEGRQIGYLEEAKARIDERLPIISDEASDFKKEMELEYRDLEEKIKQEIAEFEKKLEKIKNKFK